MNAQRLLTGLTLLSTAFSVSCLGDRVVAPDDVLPPVLAVDRQTVQLFRFARGRLVAADTVRISNNGQGPLGGVEIVGGVDYVTTARTGWLKATLEEVGTDQALLILEPVYAEDEQPAADVAEVVLKAGGSPDLKRVKVVARTLRGAVFEFSVTPLAFAAVPGDPPLTPQKLTIRNGGNGELYIPDPTLNFKTQDTDWLTYEKVGSTASVHEYLIHADPGDLGGGLYEAFLVFDSLPQGDRPKPDSVSIQLNLGQPVLAVSTSALSFTVFRGAPDPPPQTVLLRNAGRGEFGTLGALAVGGVDYGEGADGWLDVTLTDNRLDVAALTSGLDAGDYGAAITLTSQQGGDTEVQVSLAVEAPILTPSSRTIAFGMVEGDSDPPAPQSVGLTNTGSGTFEALGQITLGAFNPSVDWMEARIQEQEVVLSPTAGATSLSAGTYSTQLPIVSVNGGTDTLKVTLGVSRGLDPPNMSLSANSVGFSAVAGGASPAPQEVQASNSGGGVLGTITIGGIDYHTAPAGWLAASVADSTVTLTATTGTLGDGEHRGTVTVSSVYGGTEEIAVTFTIGEPILTASAGSASFSAVEGVASNPSQTITFTNTGSGTYPSLGNVSVGAVTQDAPGGWLSASYSSGASSGTLTISVNTAGLGAGTYEGTVPVESDHGGTENIAVTLTVSRTTDAADLVLSPDYVRMDAVGGGADPPDEAVFISNGGGGTLSGLGVEAPSYTIGTPGWLTATLQGSTSVRLEASSGSLPDGQHRATVDVTSANGGSETVTVDVFVADPVLTLSSETASFSAEEGDGTSSPASVTIDISNTGAGDFGGLGNVALGTVAPAWVGAVLNGATDQVTLSADPTGLSAGVYSGSAQVTSTQGGNATINVTLSVAPQPASPVLEVSSSSVDFFAEDGSNPANQEITLSNSGGGDFSALAVSGLTAPTYTGDSGWLTATLAVDEITLEVDVVSGPTAIGSHSADFDITWAGAPVTVTANLTVHDGTAATSLELGTSSVEFSAVFGGGNPAQRVVTLSNSGSGSLGAIGLGVIDYHTGDGGWLDTSTNSNSDVTLIPVTGTLTAGTHAATVPVESNNGGTKNLAVSITVEAPVLSLGSEHASFAAEQGGGDPTSENVGYFNSGAGTNSDIEPVGVGTITYAPPGTDWLTATPGAGVINLQPETGSLSAGVHEATVPLSSTNGGDASLTVAFSISAVSEDPVLALSANTVGFNAVFGGSSPSAKVVTISNSGGGTAAGLGNISIGSIDYHTGVAGWLDTSSNTNSAITLVPVTGSLAAQTHVATVQITSDAPGVGPEDIEVSVTVAEPVLTASTLGLSFTGLEGAGAPASQPVTFSNTGAGNDGNLGNITVGTISGGGAWLTAPSDGDPVAGGTLTFSVSQAPVVAGSYSATVPVSSQYGGSETIEVNFSVVRESDPPDMVLSATEVRFDALLGGGNPEPQFVTVSNVGGGSLGPITLGSVSYGSGALGWLTATESGGTITLQAKTSGLIEGTFTASLSVSSDGGSDQIDVTCVVGTARLTLVPRTVSFGDTVGGPGPAPAKVTVANTGGGSYESLGTITLNPIVYGDGATGWLEAIMAAPDSVELTATTTGLESRTAAYEARVPVASTLGGTDTVLVSFTVAPGSTAPQLALSQDSMTFSGTYGGDPPPSQTIVGFNSGGGEIGDLSIGAIEYGSGPQGWLAESISGRNIILEPIVDGLPAGVHEAIVTVASVNGGDKPLHVILELLPPILSLSTETVTFSDLVGSTDTLRSQVFIFNSGAGDDLSLGTITLGEIEYPQGQPGWLTTDPAPADTIEAFLLGLEGTAAGLEEGASVALVPVQSVWGDTVSLRVTFTARKLDQSFDTPTIELWKDGAVLEGDSIVVGPVAQDSAQVGVRVEVRNGAATRLDLTGLRVGVPSYPANQPTGWITGAFLDRTTAAVDMPAELFVVLAPADLSSGRYEGRLVISSESVGLEEVTPVILRIILVVS